MKQKNVIIILLLLGSILLAACGADNGSTGGGIEASGMISAGKVSVSPEQGGRVVEVLVEEGQAAAAGVRSAEAALKQAEAGLQQAQAALALLNLQIEKTEIAAPMSGTILSLNLDEGEVVGAGSVLMTLGKLSEVTLTVYVPEDRYGDVELGQQAAVTVDSHPNAIYTGEVVYISDEAEFTPRNIQTEESRRATVYAVKIRLSNPNGELKLGMPADVRLD